MYTSNRKNLLIMYTYELTPNLKTKSYRVLSDGIEVARSLAKSTAIAYCEAVEYNEDCPF